MLTRPRAIAKRKAVIAVVIPSYRVKAQILEVLRRIGPEVGKIFVVDDKCPEQTGVWVREKCRDPRVTVHINEQNLGVGGATLLGFELARKQGAEILVKIDGDGQMDPADLPRLVRPILEHRCDYAKGNRFFSPRHLKGMPTTRLLGNAALSFISKISSGYWRAMDPTNGFVALHAKVLDVLPLNKIDPRFFFESDLLFRLNTVRAVVMDVPIASIYRDEQSNLQVSRVVVPFAFKHVWRTFKRLAYSYFIRDFSLASLELVAGGIFLLAGTAHGVWNWVYYSSRDLLAPTGTVMLSALCVILGVQLLLSAISFDILNEPSQPIHPLL